MKPAAITGMSLIVLGAIALVVRSVTYFTTEHVVGPLGFFSWDVSQPHTVFINPIAGMIAVVVGLCLVLFARQRTMT